MKKYWPYITVGIFLLVVFAQECNHSNYRDDFKDELAKKDSTISIQKYVISELQQKMKSDSVQYEKEKKHIEELRGRYPDNAILDSLFKSGQSID
ncbi:hypothetical protein [Muricauda sp. MAR_2010_75]|uniref:hypothetical protein n=1 Tax=Allomuricauda sp. MAR_2010_75 TaxID=1250232 RepID=UPI00055B4ED6|nr:hypothetical protein [Muricauda sp. MAR_2010_75]